MKTKNILPFLAVLMVLFITACTTKLTEEQIEDKYAGVIPADENFNPVSEELVKSRLAIYAPFELAADLNHLSDNEKKVVSIMFDVADIMQEIYWHQTIGNKDAYFNRISDETTKKFSMINYGPWDRLNNNTSFIAEIAPKPAGANFYPADMTKEEFEAFDDSNKTSLYTLIRRNEDGSLKTVW